MVIMNEAVLFEYLIYSWDLFLKSFLIARKIYVHFVGLSREGRSITLNLTTELLLLLCGYLTFVPGVQVIHVLVVTMH